MSSQLGQEQECRVYEKDEWHSLIDYVLYLKHRYAYLESEEEIRGKSVLDFGCGSGYGADMLAQSAASVVGVDASDSALAVAMEKYNRPNLSFELIKPDYTLRFDDNSFDLITSHQVIEHIPDVERYLRLLQRVLKPGGKLVLSTPNRKFRLLPFQMIWQEAHEREYAEPHLRRDIERVFSNYELRGISGSEQVHKVYMDHYRQTPYKAYIRQPIKTLAKALIPDGAYEGLRDALLRKSRVSPPPIAKDVLAQYSLDDIRIDSSLEYALDFFVECVK